MTHAHLSQRPKGPHAALNLLTALRVQLFPTPAERARRAFELAFAPQLSRIDQARERHGKVNPSRAELEQAVRDALARKGSA